MSLTQSYTKAYGLCSGSAVGVRSFQEVKREGVIRRKKPDLICRVPAPQARGQFFFFSVMLLGLVARFSTKKARDEEGDLKVLRHQEARGPTP